MSIVELTGAQWQEVEQVLGDDKYGLGLDRVVLEVGAHTGRATVHGVRDDRVVVEAVVDVDGAVVFYAGHGEPA